MLRAVGVDMLCSRCNQETLHQASIRDGRLRSFRCLTCGTTTTIHLAPIEESTVPDPFSEIQIGTSPLRPGQLLLEGGITLPTGSPMRQALAAVRAGHAMLELDCKALRLSVETQDQLRLVLTVKASTNLPVLVDIGLNHSIAPHLLQSQADGVIFTCTAPREAEAIGHALSPSFPGLVVIRTSGQDIQAQISTAVAAVRTLCRQHHRHLAVTPQVPDHTHFALAARLLLEQVAVPIRAEVPISGHDADGKNSVSTALRAVCRQPGVLMVGMPALSPVNQAVYDVAAAVLAQSSYSHLAERDTLGAFVYITSKAFGRVVTKPRRLLHEMEYAPGVFARSLPTRLVSKPLRVIGEIRRIFSKIG